MAQEFMTVEEVAQYLRLNMQTVSRMAQRGELPAVKVGRHYRFRKDILDRYLDEQAAKTLTVAGAMT
jgi:excisionase family DNA binding protein